LEQSKKELIKNKLEFLIDEMIQTTEQATQKNSMNKTEFDYLQGMITQAMDLCEGNQELLDWFLATVEIKVDILSQM
jgi:hypothetical protein